MDYSKHKKYIESTGTHYISNSGSDENKKYRGGVAGDQSGHEWELKSWYNRPWSVVLRYEKDPRVGYLMAQLSCAAALNNKIGYDQGQRVTYWTQLSKVNYDPSAIKTACEEDCTAGVTANAKACGYLLGISSLKNLSTGIYSGNMKSNFVKAGFTALTASKYLTSGKYLQPGDVLLYENHHAAANVTIGSAIKSSYKKPDLSKVKFDGTNVTNSTTSSNSNSSTTSSSSTISTSNSTSVIGTAIAKQSMYIRKEASTSAEVIDVITKDESCDVLALLDSGWMKVKFLGEIGYTSNRNNAYFEYTTKKTSYDAFVTGAKVNIRKGPSTDYGIVKVTVAGTKINVIEEKDGFAKIGSDQWISLKYIEKA